MNALAVISSTDKCYKMELPVSVVSRVRIRQTCQLECAPGSRITFIPAGQALFAGGGEMPRFKALRFAVTSATLFEGAVNTTWNINDQSDKRKEFQVEYQSSIIRLSTICPILGLRPETMNGL